jgi:tRNA(fMet)-specific endonuclease VapC
MCPLSWAAIGASMIGSIRSNQPHVNKETLLKKYRRFYLATELFRQVRIVEFDRAAYDRYVELLTQNEALRKKRLQQDMRIAAIALSIGATVATRNQRDFGLVPGLTMTSGRS